MTDSETSEVRAAIDTDRLTAYLTDHLPGFTEPLTVRQFKGGQSNPTYLLTTLTNRYVLRKKPAGQLLPGAHMIEREYKVMSALKGSTVPVATVSLMCEDGTVIGTPFYVMDFLEGRVFRDPGLPDIAPRRPCRDLSRDERHDGRFACRRLAGGRAGRFRQVERLPDPANQPVVPAICRRQDA